MKSPAGVKSGSTPDGWIYFISLSAQAENFTMTEGHYFTSEGYFTL